MKERLDVILVKGGYAGSRSRAKEMIRSGYVYVDGRRAEKAGCFYEEDGLGVEIREWKQKYVSRGGLKLEKAICQWQLVLKGMNCMDVGASTGGFTDCMLQNGAAKVYSIDAGHGQLAEKLRTDERVICMERKNFRYMEKEDIPEELDFASVDVSFISLTKILLPARKLLKEGGQMVCLVKPQFEAGKGRVGKNGVVKNPGIHREVIAGIVDHAGLLGFRVLHLDYSPIRGPEGNIEYLLHLEKKMSVEAAGDFLMEDEDRIPKQQIKNSPVPGLSEDIEWKRLIAGTVEAAWKLL